MKKLVAIACLLSTILNIAAVQLNKMNGDDMRGSYIPNVLIMNKTNKKIEFKSKNGEISVIDANREKSCEIAKLSPGMYPDGYYQTRDKIFPEIHIDGLAPIKLNLNSVGGHGDFPEEKPYRYDIYITQNNDRDSWPIQYDEFRFGSIISKPINGSEYYCFITPYEHIQNKVAGRIIIGETKLN